MKLKMTIKELTDSGLFEVVNLGKNQEREIARPFCCDLLSIAMGRAPEGCAWVTVMANINTLAVATLADAACVVLAEDVRLDEPGLKKAVQEGVMVYRTGMPVFEAALAVYEMIHA